MKKILAYTVAAVLLGTVTMLAPFAPFVGEVDENEMDTQAEPFFSSPEYMRTRSSETEKSYGIASATYLPDSLFIAFMLGLGLAVAFGVMRYSMRKTVF